MACCVAALALISVIRTVWRTASGRGPLLAPSPPPASRPGPGGAAADVHSAHASADHRPNPTPPARFAVASALAYLGAVLLLEQAGVLAVTPSSDWPRAGATAAVVTAVVAMLQTGRRSSSQGWPVLAGGLPWLVLSVIDMHVLGLVGWTGERPALDALFHGAGLWIAAAGAALITRDRLAVRPTRTPTT